jgi:hypothetical protein
MNEDLDAWLNADVANDVAKASAGQPLVPVANDKAKGLGKFGITRGGVIRNPNTKKVTMTSNPVATPKTTKVGMTKAVKAPTPEEDFKAEHPALAIPTVMTGMDMDTVKRNGAEVSSQPAPAPVAPGQPVPVTYQSTLRDLLNLAVASGGILHFGTGEFVLSIQILKTQA